MCRMRPPVVKVLLTFLFALIVGGSVICGSQATAQTAAPTASSQADRIAAL